MSWLKGVLPFTWKESNGPVPLSIGAMLDDGTTEPDVTGPITVSMQADFGVVMLELLNAALQPVPQALMVNSQWDGFVRMHNTIGRDTTFALHFEGIRFGNSNGCTLQLSGVVPPPPPPPPPPPTPGSHTITVLYDGRVVSQVQV